MLQSQKFFKRILFRISCECNYFNTHLESGYRFFILIGSHVSPYNPDRWRIHTFHKYRCWRALWCFTVRSLYKRKKTLATYLTTFLWVFIIISFQRIDNLRSILSLSGPAPAPLNTIVLTKYCVSECKPTIRAQGLVYRLR